jgi:hypothetical protein
LELFYNGEWENGMQVVLTQEECAWKVDIAEIVCPKVAEEPSCSLYSPFGTRVVSCSDLLLENNVFIVPEGRYFMLPTKGVGFTMELDHIGRLLNVLRACLLLLLLLFLLLLLLLLLMMMMMMMMMMMIA